MEELVQNIPQLLGVALDKDFAAELTELESRLDSSVVLSVLSAPAQKRATYLHALLTSLVKGHGKTIIASVTEANGFEALRLLLNAYQPQSRARALGVLQQLTSFPNFKPGPLTPQVLDFERAIMAYHEASGQSIGTELQTALCMKFRGLVWR